MGGKIVYNGKNKSHIGFSENVINSGYKVNTVFYNEGTIVFNGHFAISKGCALKVNNGAYLEFGSKFHVSQLTKIECRKNIVFGDNVTISWNCLIMDSDTHKILNNGKQINSDKNIKIGNNVWICSNTFISKGSIIPDGCVIAANSKVTKNLLVSNAIYAGNKVIKENIYYEI